LQVNRLSFAKENHKEKGTYSAFQKILIARYGRRCCYLLTAI